MTLRRGMWSRSKPVEAVKTINRWWKPQLVLDIGCGNGRNMIFPVSVGLDNDERAVATARERGPCVLGDAHHLPFRKAFDVSLLCYVLNFVEDPNQAWREAVRVSQREPVYTIYNGAQQALHVLEERR